MPAFQHRYFSEPAEGVATVPGTGGAKSVILSFFLVALLALCWLLFRRSRRHIIVVRFQPATSVHIASARVLDEDVRNELWWRSGDLCSYSELVQGQEYCSDICPFLQEGAFLARKTYVTKVLKEQKKQMRAACLSPRIFCRTDNTELDDRRMAKVARRASKDGCQFALQRADLLQQEVLNSLECGTKGLDEQPFTGCTTPVSTPRTSMNGSSTPRSSMKSPMKGVRKSVKMLVSRFEHGVGRSAK